jgi:hypothetical protein
MVGETSTLLPSQPSRAFEPRINIDFGGSRGLLLGSLTTAQKPEKAGMVGEYWLSDPHALGDAVSTNGPVHKILCTGPFVDTASPKA